MAGPGCCSGGRGQARRLRGGPAGLLLLALMLAGAAQAAEPSPAAAGAEAKAQALEKAAEAAAPPPAEKLTSGETQAVDPAGKEPLDDAITCLARSIYWEAKGEDRASLEAIAAVVMNRLGHDGFPDTVCGVVKDGKEAGACQFSWWCDGRPDQVEEEKQYAICKEIAREALNRQLKDRTGGALYFHHKRLSPDWAGEYIKTGQVGDHLFYKPKGEKAS